MTVGLAVYTSKGVDLLSDRRASFGQWHMQTEKLVKAGKYAFAYAGFTAALDPLADFLRSGKPLKNLRHDIQLGDWVRDGSDTGPPGTGVEALITDGTTIWRVTGELAVLKVHEPYAGIGSGGMVAVAALMAGASPRRAVEIACELVSNCGDGVDYLHVPKRKR